MIELAKDYFLIPGYVLFWGLFVVAVALFLRRSYLLAKMVMLGRQEDRFDNLTGRLSGMIVETLFQWCNLKNVTLKDRAGVGHAILFWGFCLFFIYYVIFLGFGTGLGFSRFLADTAFERAYSAIMNFAALCIIIALIWAAVRRYVIKPERLKGVDSSEAGIILMLIFCLMVLHIFSEGFYYAYYMGGSTCPPLGVLLGGLINNMGISGSAAHSLFEISWWLHYLLVLGFLVFIPYSKHLHILASPVNTIFKDTGPKGVLKSIDITKPEDFKLLNIEDFTWKRLLDGFSCTVCGRCYDVCPARQSGKALSPRELILGIKDQLLESGPGLIRQNKVADNGEGSDEGQEGSQRAPLVGSLITEEEIWACTTCRMCQEVCPASNEQMNAIIDIRRHLQMGALTKTGQDTLKNLRVRMHPWRGTMNARTDWTEGMDIKIVGEDDDIDVLFWVGCTEALEDRCIKVAQSVASILKSSGVNFGILGEEEICCGDPARRMGSEHIYQMLAMTNIQLLNDYNIKKIITACPHCYNTLKNEYPQFGGDFEIIHHTELFSEYIQSKRLDISQDNEYAVTYHDPCYLGRHNNVFEPGRDIIKSIPKLNLVEMEKNRKNSVCCGGGGGRLWLEEDMGKRISKIRLGQAVETEANTVVTACPYCLQMLESEKENRPETENIKIRDIAEILYESIKE